MADNMGNCLIINVKYSEYDLQTRIDKSKFEMELIGDEDSKISISWEDFDKHFEEKKFVKGRIELLREDKILMVRVNDEDITCFSEENLNWHRTKWAD